MSALSVFSVRLRGRRLTASGEVASGVPLGGHRRFTLFLKEHSCVLSAWPLRRRLSALWRSAARRASRPAPLHRPARSAVPIRFLIQASARQPLLGRRTDRRPLATRPRPVTRGPTRPWTPNRRNYAYARCSARARSRIPSPCARGPSTSAPRVLTTAGAGCHARRM